MEKFLVKNGIIPALISPFTSDGKFDLVSFSYMIVKLNEKKPSAYFVGGGAGEGERLFRVELEDAIKVAMEYSNGIPVIAHLGFLPKDVMLKLAEGYAKSKLAAVSAIVPAELADSTEGLTAFYNELSAFGLPVLPYLFNRPPKCHADRMKNTAAARALGDALVDIKNLGGVKITDTYIENIEDVIHAAKPTGAPVFSGKDFLLLDAYRRGAAGCISASANVLLGPMQLILKKYKKRKFKAAFDHYAKFQFTVNAMSQDDNLVLMIKNFLVARTIIQTSAVRKDHLPFKHETFGNTWEMACELPQ